MHSFDPKFMKLSQTVNHHNISVRLKLGHVGSKTRSLGQILEKPSVPSRWHSFDLKFMKLCQKNNHHYIKVKLKLGQVGSKIRLLGQILEKNLVYILEGTVLIQSS